jgi:hypothetical protein
MTTDKDLIHRFLAADQKERKKLLAAVLAGSDRATAERIAVVIRDPSPRVAARVTSLLARHGLDELFESLLPGLKPGKITLLRSHYARIRGSGEDKEE